MAIIRTARGTASSKTSGTTLTVSGVQSDGRSTMVVGVSWDDSVGNPTVEHGGHDIPWVVRNSGGGNGVSTAIYSRTRTTNKVKTEDMVVTFPSAVTAKVMFVTQYTEISFSDLTLSNSQTNVTSANAGIATLTNFDDEACIAAFGSEGPSGDTQGAAALEYTLGQRVGTTGGTDDTNITIQETYKILTETESTRARLTDITARDVTSCLVTLAGHREHYVGISPSDLYKVETIFENKLTPLNIDDLGFRYNHYTGRWEAYDVTDFGTLIAYQDGGWTEV